MTHPKKVIDAYGNNYEAIYPYIKKHGWIKYAELTPLTIGIDFKYKYIQFMISIDKNNNETIQCWRPKVLSRFYQEE